MNKKGFTLIELLAIIIILGAISILVTPVITSVIETAQSSSAKQSAVSYVKEVNNVILENKIGANRIYDGVYTVSELSAYGIAVIGTKPTGGVVTISNEKVTDYAISINNYCITSISGNITTKKGITPSECK